MNNILKRLEQIIAQEERFLLKFPEGSSQHSLLRNRIQSLYTAQNLLSGESATREELEFALPRIESIFHKTRTARDKYEPGTRNYKRFDPMVQDMAAVRDAIRKAMGD